ncbi:DivIVA domain-containing protein [Mangrovihabitans endophyticus]|nr:DivIVA domain-containing protein [Mangrovihabitans endophyticus]
MGQLLLFVVVALVVGAIVFGVTVMLGGGDSGLTPVEPDGQSAPLPGDRPLGEEDIVHARFDTALRGYRMSQVDQALKRAAYDIGYKSELIGVLEAEVLALREGRTSDADMLRRAREAAVIPAVPTEARTDGAEPGDDADVMVTGGQTTDDPVGVVAEMPSGAPPVPSAGQAQKKNAGSTRDAATEGR